MATLPFCFLVLLLLPFSALVNSEPLSDDVDHPPKPQQDAALILELHNLKRQFQDLEESSLEKDLVIHDKEKLISSLRAELESFKKKESLQYDSVLNELGSKVTQLEDDLERTELQLQEFKNKAESLETAQALNSAKVKQLEKLVADQKKQITKTEKALRASEATLLRVQEEADMKEKELRKVHGGWLPPWTSIRVVELQAIASEQWIKYGQPLVETTAKRASEKVAAAQEWTKPYVENLKLHAQKKLIPGLKRSTDSLSAKISPHFELAKTRVLEGYQTSKDTISSQLQNLQDAVGPHIQVAKETCKPYVDEAASFLRPYYEQVQSITKPYRKKLFKSYQKFLTSATAYYSQLQVSMKGKLEKVDFLAPLASNELVWFLSAALLLLPILVTYTVLSSALGPSKKPVKPHKSHHGGHHKKAKRAKQVDK